MQNLEDKGKESSFFLEKQWWQARTEFITGNGKTNIASIE